MSHLHTNMFLAIPLPDSVQMYMNQRALQLQFEYPFKSWVALGDYHITLVFLGKVDSNRMEQLQAALSSVIPDHPTFRITVDRIGMFGKKQRPGVLWAGVSDNNALIDLQNNLNKTCAGLGFDLDKRPYHPHITLARKWNSLDRLETSEFRKGTDLDSEMGTWIANEVILFQSHPDKSPKYEPVRIFPLNETLS